MNDPALSWPKELAHYGAVPLEPEHLEIISEYLPEHGRAIDNVFVERLWRSVTYEGVYLKDYVSVPDARAGLTHYFAFYNHERLH